MAFSKAFIPKGVLRPLFTFILHFVIFLFKIVILTAEIWLPAAEREKTVECEYCEMFYGDALGAYNQD